MPNFLLHQGEALLAQCRREVKAVSLSPGMHRVHRLRVSIKRLRALLRTVRQVAPDTRPPRGTLKGLRTLFLALGELREQQVNISLVRRMRHLPPDVRAGYMKHAAGQAVNLQRKVHEAMKHLRRKEVDRIARYLTDALDGLDDRTAQRDLRRVLRSEWAATRRFLNLRDQDLHGLRKRVKRVSYLMRLMKRKGPPLSALPKSAALGVLQKTLGDWHDAFVLHADVSAWHGGGPAQRLLLEAVAHLAGVREKRALVEIDALKRSIAEQRSRARNGPGTTE